MTNTDATFMVCAACAEPPLGAYCHVCGQKRPDRSRFSVAYLLTEAVHELTSFDGKLWGTSRLLCSSPGRLVNDYLAGRGSLHIGPVKLFLRSLTIYFFLTP